MTVESVYRKPEKHRWRIPTFPGHSCIRRENVVFTFLFKVRSYRTKTMVNKVLKKGIIFSFFIFLFCMNFFSGYVSEARAEETEKPEGEIMEEIKTHRDSVVHIESICWDGDAEIYRTKSFSGFVVSKDTTGIYVVTVHDKLVYSSEEKEAIKKELGVENNVRISEKIEVVFNGDLRVKASIVGESGQRNLTVLKLDQMINFEGGLQFLEKNASDKERVFLLSYPETGDVYNTENVMITSGTISNFYLVEEIIFFSHDIQADKDSIGGPLLNQDGRIVGLFLTSREEKNGKAISSEAIKDFLDTFNVSYQEYEEVAKEEELPVLNIFLGAIIVGLSLIIVLRVVRQRTVREKTVEKDNTKRKEKTEKWASGKVANALEKTSASLEYSSEKKIVLIHKNTFIIGRGPEADFVLSGSKCISRKHACIQFDGKDFYLTDLHSTNHTFLNGSEVIPGEKRSLRNGDEIMAGREIMIFHRMGRGRGGDKCGG